jgi:hypothetical protein
MTLRHSISMLALMLLVASSFAVWDVQGASGQVCFITNYTEATTGSASSGWYDMVVGSVPLNGSFWNSTLLAWHNQSLSQRSMFHFASNTTHAFFMVPVVRSLSAGQNESYCVYAGSSDMDSAHDAAPYGMGFSSYSELLALTADNSSPYAVSDNGDGSFNVSSIGRVGFRPSSAGATYTDVQMLVKYLPLGYNASSATSIIGAYSGYTVADANGAGVGLRQGNRSAGWYQTALDMNASQPEWVIARLMYKRGATGDMAAIYHQNMSLNSSISGSIGANGGNLQLTYPLYIRNASAQVEWGIAFKGASLAATTLAPWDVRNAVYDYNNPNISIVSPSWHQTIGAGDAALLTVQYLSTFDNCTALVNGDAQTVHSTLTPGQTTVETLDDGDMISGTNEIVVSCYLSGVETHRYWYFTKILSDSSSFFEEAFGFTPASMGCSADIQTALGNCNESYRLDQIYPFAAVICPHINTSKDYGCLGLSNLTKNNYTMFFSPSTWSYASSTNIPHVGANFYYSNAELPVRIELISPTKFIYIPAQTQPRDCGVYFSSTTTGCSWWGGFTINNATVVLSDHTNRWYAAGGRGIEQFNINYSQIVIDTTVVPITDIGTSSFFTDGIYTRAACYQSNGNFLIYYTNTKAQLYTLTVTGNTSYSISLTALTFNQNISLTNVTGVYVTTGNGTSPLCSYTGNNLMFLPFSLPDIGIDGFQILIWVMMLFVTILSAITPFALFILFMLNDTYQLLTIDKIAMIAAFSIVAGFVNNAFSLDRGIKHMVMVAVLLMAYITTLYITVPGISISESALKEIDDFVDGANMLLNPNGLEQIAIGATLVLVSLAVLVLKFPFIFMDVVFGLLMQISPQLASSLLIFRSLATLGFLVYIFFQFVQILKNLFRNI